MDIDNDVKNMPKLKKKGEKNIFVTIFKIVALIIVFVLQVAIMLALYTTAKGLYTYARLIFDIFKIVAILYLLYHHDNSAYKVSWILFILFFPVIGLVAYILWGNSKLRKKKELAIRKIRVESEDLLRNSENIAKELYDTDRYKYNQIQYMTKVTGFPVYKNQGLEYFDIGEKFFESLKKDLLKADKYILMEFFILSKGKLWDEIFEIYRTTDLFVLASTGEPAAVSHLEAMSFSIPVISGEDNGTACYVEGGINGYICRDNDKEDLRKKVEAVISDRERLKAMGAESYRLVQERHQFDSYYEKIMEILARMEREK